MSSTEDVTNESVSGSIININNSPINLPATIQQNTPQETSYQIQPLTPIDNRKDDFYFSKLEEAL